MGFCVLTPSPLQVERYANYRRWASSGWMGPKSDHGTSSSMLKVDDGIVIYPGAALGSGFSKVWSLRGCCDDRTMTPVDIGKVQTIDGPAVSDDRPAHAYPRLGDGHLTQWSYIDS